MKKKTKAILFSVLFFGPILIAALWVGGLFLFLHLISLQLNNVFAYIQTAAYIALLVMPFIVARGSFFLSKRAKSWWRKLGIIYFGWLICSIPLALFASSATTSLSMSVSDGGNNNNWDFLAEIMKGMVYYILIFHVFIVPWVGIIFCIVWFKLPTLIRSDIILE